MLSHMLESLNVRSALKLLLQDVRLIATLDIFSPVISFHLMRVLTSNLSESDSPNITSRGSAFQLGLQQGLPFIDVHRPLNKCLVPGSDAPCTIHCWQARRMAIHT